MIKHVYLFKLKDKSKAPEIIEKLNTLKEKIPYIQELEVATDFKGDANSWDLVQSITFLNMEDFKRFGTDEYHCQIREYMNVMREEGIKIDYEI